jgi:hypothetical protein
MTIQTINIGQIANDGTGDDLREAFRKVNENFDELDLRQPESTTGSNLGSGEAIFAGKVGDALTFNNITTSGALTISTVAGNNVQISTNLQGVLYVSDQGSSNIDDGDVFNINGGPGIQTTLVGNTLTITNTGGTGGGVSAFDSDLDFGEIIMTVQSHADYLRLTTDVDYGTVTSPVQGISSDMNGI